MDGNERVFKPQSTPSSGYPAKLERTDGQVGTSPQKLASMRSEAHQQVTAAQQDPQTAEAYRAAAARIISASPDQDALTKAFSERRS